MTNRRAFVLVVAIFFFLSGCSGSMKGVVRRDAKRIEMTYTDMRVGKGLLETVLPGGERFEGRIVKIGAMDIQSDTTIATSQSAAFDDVQVFEGNAKATLSGSRGNIMKCRFNLTDSLMGISSGGFGLCQVSDGRVIDIFF